MSRKAQLVANEKGYENADHVNKAGHKSFSRPLKEQFLQCLTTNVLENTFYASKNELAKDTVDLHTKMLNEDPRFFAKALIYARNDGRMRLQPIIGLVGLSTLKDKKLFKRAFNSVIRTPGDLASFVEFCKESGIRHGLGRVIKQEIGNWLNNMSEYHAIKYGGDGKKYSIRNILRLARPVPRNLEHVGVFHYVVNGKLMEKDMSSENLNQIKAYEELKKVETNKERIDLIEKARLPYEAVTGIGFKMDTEMWTYLMKQMPYFALLRHLNTLNKNGVFGSKENVDYVVGRLTDKNAIVKSKVMPFRFYTAYSTTADEKMPMRLRDALIDAMEMSFENMPEIEGRVAIGVDTSASMSSNISGKGRSTYMDIAAIFATAMMKKCDDVIVIPFDTMCRDVSMSQRDSIMTNAKKLRDLCGGGTDVGLPMKYLNDNKDKVDVFIGITDNEEWHTKNGHRFGYYKGYSSEGFEPEHNKYIAQVNPKLKTFLVTISPYRDSVVPEKKNTWCVYGWNEGVVDFITGMANGGKTQIDAVEAIQL